MNITDIDLYSTFTSGKSVGCQVFGSISCRPAGRVPESAFSYPYTGDFKNMVQFVRSGSKFFLEVQPVSKRIRRASSDVIKSLGGKHCSFKDVFFNYNGGAHSTSSLKEKRGESREGIQDLENVVKVSTVTEEQAKNSSVLGYEFPFFRAASFNRGFAQIRSYFLPIVSQEEAEATSCFFYNASMQKIFRDSLSSSSKIANLYSEECYVFYPFSGAMTLLDHNGSLLWHCAQKTLKSISYVRERDEHAELRIFLEILCQRVEYLQDKPYRRMVPLSPFYYTPIIYNEESGLLFCDSVPTDQFLESLSVSWQNWMPLIQEKRVVPYPSLYLYSPVFVMLGNNCFESNMCFVLPNMEKPAFSVQDYFCIFFYHPLGSAQTQIIRKKFQEYKLLIETQWDWSDARKKQLHIQVLQENAFPSDHDAPKIWLSVQYKKKMNDAKSDAGALCKMGCDLYLSGSTVSGISCNAHTLICSGAWLWFSVLNPEERDEVEQKIENVLLSQIVLFLDNNSDEFLGIISILSNQKNWAPALRTSSIDLRVPEPMMH